MCIKPTNDKIILYQTNLGTYNTLSAITKPTEKKIFAAGMKGTMNNTIPMTRILVLSFLYRI